MKRPSAKRATTQTVLQNAITVPEYSDSDGGKENVMATEGRLGPRAPCPRAPWLTPMQAAADPLMELGQKFRADLRERDRQEQQLANSNTSGQQSSNNREQLPAKATPEKLPASNSNS